MRTAINGRVRLRFFWRCMYSCGGMTPIKRIFRLGNLILAKVVYAAFDPFDKRYYRADVLELLSTFFDVRWEITPLTGDDMWHAVYSDVDGGYVGTPEDAYRLFQQGIICAQKAQPQHKVCSIGFNQAEQKWYGWSHRARYGFGIGDVVKDGDCCASSGWTEDYLKAHPEERVYLDVGFEAKTLDDAKKMAIAFAESVS